MANPALRLKGLAKTFDGNDVFSGVDLEVDPGDRIVILGASGSGKSTLLRCINVLETPDSGQIEVGGTAVGEAGRKGTRYSERELCALRQRVGMVFQKPNPFPKSIRENVAYGPKIHGIARSKADNGQAPGHRRSSQPGTSTMAK